VTDEAEHHFKDFNVGIRVMGPFSLTCAYVHLEMTHYYLDTVTITHSIKRFSIDSFYRCN
jgi:hypothetical protein